MYQKNIPAEVATQLKARSRAAFDSQAPTYDTGMQGSHARKLYARVVDEVLRAAANVPAPRILDLGCGTGALATLVLDALPAAALIGIDLSHEMAAIARKRLAGSATVLVGDAERLPFHDAMFDIVYCCDSFHHYPDPNCAAFQAWRVLKPGGTLVIGDVWQPAPARGVMNAWMPHSNEGDVRIYSEAELRGILGAWFGRVSWQRVGLTACLAVTRK